MRLIVAENGDVVIAPEMFAMAEIKAEIGKTQPVIFAVYVQTKDDKRYCFAKCKSRKEAWNAMNHLTSTLVSCEDDLIDLSSDYDI